MARWVHRSGPWSNTVPFAVFEEITKLGLIGLIWDNPPAGRAQLDERSIVIDLPALSRDARNMVADGTGVTQGHVAAGGGGP